VSVPLLVIDMIELVVLSDFYRTGFAVCQWQDKAQRDWRLSRVSGSTPHSIEQDQQQSSVSIKAPIYLFQGFCNILVLKVTVKEVLKMHKDTDNFLCHGRR
jgi:hypothetical protein